MRDFQQGAEQRREYAEAKAWHEASTRYRDMTIKKDETEKEYYAAKATQATDPERYKAAWLQYRQAYKLYQSTAVEADAWAVGGKVESQLGFKPNDLETELAKMPADPRTFKAITTGDTPSTPLRSRAIGTGAPPSYKPQLGSTSPPISTVGSDVDGSMPPFTPPVRQGRKLGGFSPLTPFDPSTISATDTQVPDLDDSPSGGSASPFTPPVRQGRKLVDFSPLTPLRPEYLQRGRHPGPGSGRLAIGWRDLHVYAADHIAIQRSTPPASGCIQPAACPQPEYQQHARPRYRRSGRPDLRQ